MGFLAPFGKAPGSRRAARTAPWHRPNLGAANEKGPPFGEGLGRLEAGSRIRTGGKGFAGLCLTTCHFAVDMKGPIETGPMHAMERTTGLEPATPTLAGCALPAGHVRLRININIRDAAGGRKEFFKFCAYRNLIAVKCPRENKLDAQDTSLLQIFTLILAVYLIARGIIWLAQRYRRTRMRMLRSKISCAKENSIQQRLCRRRLVGSRAIWKAPPAFKNRQASAQADRKVKNELRASYLSACTPLCINTSSSSTVSSVLGLLLETVYTLVVFGVLESRVGLIWGPFSPLYGCGAVLLTALLWEAAVGPWKIFCISAAIGVLRQFTGWSMEHLAHAQSWTYLGLPDHISQWVAWRFLAMWGIVGLVWCRTILPELLYRIGEPTTARQAAVVTLLAVFIALDAGMTVACFLRAGARANGIPPANPIDVYLDTRYGDSFMNKFENMRIGQDHPLRPDKSKRR